MQIDKCYKWLTKPSSLLLYIGFTLFCYLYLDKPISLYFYKAQWQNRYPWIELLTKLGLGGSYLIGLLIITLFFKYSIKHERLYKQSLFLFSSVLISSLICLIIKTSLARARPTQWLHYKLYGFYGFSIKASFMSFPSGHTCSIISLMIALSYLFPRYFYLFLSLGVTVATTRLVLCSHFLSDLLAGFFLAFLVVGKLKNSFYPLNLSLKTV